MTDNPQDELNGLLGAAVRELIDTVGDQPPADLNDEVLRQFSRRGELVRQQDSSRSRRFAMVLKCGLAASILAIVAIAISGLGILGGQRTLYAQIADRVEELHSLVCRVQWVDDMGVDVLDSEQGQRVTFLAPSRHRIEDPAGGIHIIDTRENKAIYLNPKAKEAVVIQVEGGNMASLSPIPLVKTLRDHFRKDRVADEGVHELGEREIAGARAIGVRSSMNGEVVEAWVDPTTHLPLEVRLRLVIPAHLAGGKKTTMWRAMTNFQYDVEVDRTLMAMRVPDGYTEIAMPNVVVDRSPATLDDLIALLRVCAKHNDAMFPRSLKMNDDEGTCMAIMKRYAGKLDKAIASGSDAEQQAALKSVTAFGALLGRSTPFLYSLKEEHDLHYFAGARLNQPNRPLLWYSPDGRKNYKVVYADLSVKDLAADTLPAEPVPTTPEVEPESVGAESWPSPTLKLPPQAVRDYANLQAIRADGKQATVEHLVLGWMPELIDSPPRPTDASTIEPQVMPDNWKPSRSPDSARLKFLEEFPNLRGLDLVGLYLTQKDLDTIGQCKNLERLSLSGVQILEQSPRRLSGDDLQKLSNLTKLKEVDLGQSNFVGGLHHLSELPHLQRLYLGSFEHLNDKSVAELQVLPHLETLVLSPVYGTNPEKTVTDAGLLSLQELPKLKILYVGWHGKWTMPVEKLRELLPKVKIKAGE